MESSFPCADAVPGTGRQPNGPAASPSARVRRDASPGNRLLTLFLCGDVMTGRGIDQVLPHPADPGIHEPYVSSSLEYVRLAEAAHGPIPRPVEFTYPWGDALEELGRVAPEARLINLETSITRSDDHWRGKGINYRMHPDNVGCLIAARIDVCALANNHVLDFGYAGLVETLGTLKKAGLRPAGAGRSLAEAREPAVVDLADTGRVVVLGLGTRSSGIPPSWARRTPGPGSTFSPTCRTLRRGKSWSEFSGSSALETWSSCRSIGDPTGATRCPRSIGASRAGCSTAASTSSTATRPIILARWRSTEAS